MEGMTNEQYKTQLKMILKLVEKSKDKEEIIETLKALINED